MPVEQADLSAAARSYEAVLCANAGTPPVLDLVHLGLGVDGHTASLVPARPVARGVWMPRSSSAGPYQGLRRTLTPSPFPAIELGARLR